MRYKGYTTSMKYSDEDAVFYGVIEGIKDSVSFESENENDFVLAFHEAVDDYEDILIRMNKREKVTRVIRIAGIILMVCSGWLGIGLANHNMNNGNILVAMYDALFVIVDTIILVSLCKR